MTKPFQPIVFAFLLSIIGFATILPASAADINPKDYGATGNGSTDDQVALEKAFAAANSTPNSTVLFPAGSYLHSGKLFGTNGTAVAAAPKATVSLIATTAEAAVHLSGEGASVEKVQFGTNSGGGTAIVFDKNATKFTAKSVVVVEGFAVGIKAVSGRNGTIKNCEISVKPNKTGLRCESCNKVSLEKNTWIGDVHTSNKNITAAEFNGCENVSVTGDNFRYTDVAVAVTNSKTFKLSTSRIEPCFVGVLAANVSDLNVSNCAFEGLSRSSGLALDTHACRGLTADGNQIGNLLKACQIADGSNVQVNDNKIENVGGGIAVTDAENVSVNENEITSSNSFGIFLQFDDEKVDCLRNKLQNCGLGSSPTLAVIEANCPLSPRISIGENQYSGNTKGLSFFVRCIQRHPQANLFGNVTNTMLPSK
ncbi:MAG: right-handed parallel beta-helix repeat-containing protein [Cyanobacteria bacterium SZAS-4]|nr:right-handed parallel beta-helix repeat-containing protein [Cyanobacteria bacterium SZAS-4]